MSIHFIAFECRTIVLNGDSTFRPEQKGKDETTGTLVRHSTDRETHRRRSLIRSKR